MGNSLSNYSNYTVWMLHNLFCMTIKKDICLFYCFDIIQLSVKAHEEVENQSSSKIWDLISSLTEQPYLCSCPASAQNQAIQSNLCRSKKHSAVDSSKKVIENNHPSLKTSAHFVCMSKTLACCHCATLQWAAVSISLWLSGAFSLTCTYDLTDYVSMFQTQQFWFTGLFHIRLV